MGDVISAVDQLRQTIEALRLDGNVGLNVIGILMNTDMTHDEMMGCGNIAYRSNTAVRTAAVRVGYFTLRDTRLARSSVEPLSASSDILGAAGHK